MQLQLQHHVRKLKDKKVIKEKERERATTHGARVHALLVPKKDGTIRMVNRLHHTATTKPSMTNTPLPYISAMFLQSLEGTAYFLSLLDPCKRILPLQTETDGHREETAFATPRRRRRRRQRTVRIRENAHGGCRMHQRRSNEQAINNNITSSRGSSTTVS